MSASFFALARGVFSQDMNLFQYKTKSTASRTSRLLLPLAIATAVMCGIAGYADGLITPLADLGLASLVPTLFVVFFTIISLFEGIYKSSSILFDCRDDALLFSLPIPRRRIFAVRVAKLLAFQTLYNALFMLPAFAVYAFRIQPGLTFYPTALLMLILTPLIPTAIAVLIGYVIKVLALKSRFQKFAQIFFTFFFLALIGVVMVNAQGIFGSFVENAASITDIVSRIYYPAGVFARLITDFQIPDFISLIAACVLPLAAVIYLCSIRYFHVISKTNSHTTTHRQVAITGHQSSVTTALIKREISRYFSSSVFVFNSLFGLILLLIAVILLSINFEALVAPLFSLGGENLNITDITTALPTIYTAGLIFMPTMTSITSSSISIEGKTFLITRTLPVTPAHLLKSKLLASLAITYPILFLCDAIFIFRFAPSPIHILAITAISVLVPIFTGLVGLLINLKYPKMNASSDAEVVKQSASSALSVLVGMVVGLASVIATIACHEFWSAPLITSAVFLLTDLALWHLLKTWGIKKFHQIEV